MTTYALPPSLSARLSSEVAAYIPTYITTSLTESAWHAVRVPVYELTAATEPTSVKDAQVQMSILSKYLAWAQRFLGSADPHQALDPDLVARYVTTNPDKSMTETLGSRNSRLNRYLRVLAGEPARTIRHPRPVGPAPYSIDELRQLADAAQGAVPLAVALALALADGLVVPHVSGATIPAPDRARAAAVIFGVDGGWVERLSEAEDTPLSTPGWDAARRAAERAGIPLYAKRLRATWRHHHLQAGFADTTRARGLSRADLDNAWTHLPIPPAEQARVLLRG